MANKTFIPTTGPQTWATSGNWTPSGVPIAGDRVYIRAGDATLAITAGSTQAAVNLAELVIYDSFGGSFVVDVDYTIARVGAPSGGTTGTGGSGKIQLSPSGSSTTIVHKTAASTEATSGYSAFRYNPTSTANALYVLGGTVDIGSDLAAAVVDTLDVQDGTVIVWPAATTKAITQSGGTIRHGGISDAAGSIYQTKGDLYTSGNGLIPTVTIGGTAYLNHRNAAGDDVTTMAVLGSGTLNVAGDPRDLDTDTPIVLAKNGKIIAFSAAQLTGGVTWPNASTVSVL